MKTIEQLFNETGAIQTGHFQLSSGLHSDTYCQCQRFLQYPEFADRAAVELSTLLRPWLGVQAPTILAPAMGGLVIGQSLARALRGRFLFAEKTSTGGFELRRGQVLGLREAVVVVEDVVTTGGSAKKVVDLLNALGARTVAVASLVDRTEANPFENMPFVSLLRPKVQAWEPTGCSLCEARVPLDQARLVQAPLGRSAYFPRAPKP